MIRDVSGGMAAPSLAIVVSEESNDYWLEQQWLGGRLNALGLPTVVVRPQELHFDDRTGVSVDVPAGPCDPGASVDPPASPAPSSPAHGACVGASGDGGSAGGGAGGLDAGPGTVRRHVDVVYRFFELFDLANVPKVDLLMVGFVRFARCRGCHCVRKCGRVIDPPSTGKGGGGHASVGLMDPMPPRPPPP
jgi:hypothetical protein